MYVCALKINLRNLHDQQQHYRTVADPLLRYGHYERQCTREYTVAIDKVYKFCLAMYNKNTHIHTLLYVCSCKEMYGTHSCTML